MPEEIIIVERSATLRHLVQRTLGATGVIPQASLSHYCETAAHIDSHEVAAAKTRRVQSTRLNTRA